MATDGGRWMLRIPSSIGVGSDDKGQPEGSLKEGSGL